MADERAVSKVGAENLSAFWNTFPLTMWKISHESAINLVVKNYHK
jgi:hypothetical protein